MTGTPYIQSSLVVLSSVRYGETSLIVKAYTRELGIQSYLVRGVLKPKKSGLRSAYFQPLSFLDAVVTYKPNSDRLETIKEARPLQAFSQIHSDVVKSSTVLFLAELFSASLIEQQQDYDLFDFIIGCLEVLESEKSFPNYLIVVLLVLSKHLGIYPDSSLSNGTLFDPATGQFQSETSRYSLSAVASMALNEILGMNFDETMRTTIDKKTRGELLEGLVRYYDFQLAGFRRPKSLEVIRGLFE